MSEDFGFHKEIISCEFDYLYLDMIINPLSSGIVNQLTVSKPSIRATGTCDSKIVAEKLWTTHKNNVYTCLGLEK